MIMSSAKATVLATTTAYGLNFDKNIEIRSDDLDQVIKEEVDSASRAGPSSAAASISHSKPKAPGRAGVSKTKIAKFKVDEA